MDESTANETPSVFGANMRRMREARGWSQSELARQLQERGWPKYSQVAVSRTEEDARTVRLDEAIAIARIFERRVDDLLDPKSVVDAWARLRVLMDDHSDNVTSLRAAVSDFEDSYLLLKLLSFELEGSIAEEGGQARVSETMQRTLDNARRILTVSAHDVVDQALQQRLEEDGDGEHPEEA